MALRQLDIVVHLMRLSDWYPFLNQRLVCRLWRDASLLCPAHWFWWLDHFAPRDGPTVFIDHCYGPFYGCPDPADTCRVRKHFASAQRPAKILKTMPLCDQVFRWGAERRYANDVRYANDAEFRVREARKQVAVAEERVAARRAALASTTHYVDLLATRLAQRKRKRILLPVSKATAQRDGGE